MRLFTSSLREFFRERVQKIRRRRKVELLDDTEVYLVNLLAGYLEAQKLHAADGTKGLDEPLALIYARALSISNPSEQVQLLKTIGDRSLYVSGFFADSFNRKLFDVDYYIAMGRNAYTVAASKRITLAQTFAELSEKFSKLVELIAEISETSGMKSDMDLLRLYEKWLHTKSERLREQLVEEGILPVDTTREIH